MVGNPFAYDSLFMQFVTVGKIDVADYGGGVGSYGREYTECPESIDATVPVRTGVRSGSLQLLASFDVSEYGNGDYLSYEANVPTLTIEYSYTQ